MLHPSYTDLIEVANKHVENGDQPVVSSRYSIILAAAKRARQLVEGADPLVQGNEKKPLSVAIDELAEDQIHILPYGAGEEEAGAPAKILEELAGFEEEFPEENGAEPVNDMEETDSEEAGSEEEIDAPKEVLSEEVSEESETEEE